MPICLQPLLLLLCFILLQCVFDLAAFDHSVDILASNGLASKEEVHYKEMHLDNTTLSGKICADSDIPDTATVPKP